MGPIARVPAITCAYVVVVAGNVAIAIARRCIHGSWGIHISGRRGSVITVAIAGKPDTHSYEYARTGKNTTTGQ
jgi:hypothetical protein